MTKRPTPSHTLLATALIALVTVSGCKMSFKEAMQRPLDSVTGMHSAKQKRLATAAAAAIAAGKEDEALIKYKKLHAKHKWDHDIALNYAQLLRKAGHASKAVSVLSPLADSSDATHLFETEYAACLIADGQFEQGETRLRDILEDNAATDMHADAYNLYGVSLDARGQHKEAEVMFRKALDTWPEGGDVTSVMNNLALNLAHNGQFDESLNMLRKAQVMSPHNKRVAENIEIVGKLRNAIVPKAPASR
ncbi:MAG: tetratricopeptide repeat protein [Alphaproteobacteria bacterium]|nr:tetratricopeptide repeat protein [Alphaproteobacteria bacterium]